MKLKKIVHFTLRYTENFDYRKEKLNSILKEDAHSKDLKRFYRKMFDKHDNF